MSIELDAALHWLKAMDNAAMGAEVQGHARTLLDAFGLPRGDRPDEHSTGVVMPAEPTQAAVDAMLAGYGQTHLAGHGMLARMEGAYRALRAQLAQNPAPATETVWRTSWSTEDGGGKSDDLHTEADALRMAGEYLRRNPGAKVWIWSHEVCA